MSWNSFVYGEGKGCKQGHCNCYDLFAGIARDTFVVLRLKSSTTIDGYFVGIFDNKVVLHSYDDYRPYTKKICCEDVVSVTSYGPTNTSELQSQVGSLGNRVGGLETQFGTLQGQINDCCYRNK
ncbi:hypothetical protein ACV1QZ_20725 [Bacillus subtilis]|uniref:hypothetical protein n=1 Tax=Bacillus subtilis TaxID=1423 RepID=UPI004056390C